MKRQSCVRYGKHQRRALLKLVLLMLPALFWSAIFMVIAGVGPLERVVERVPDAAQLVIAFVCPSLALMLGVAALRQSERQTGSESRALSLVTIAAGVALFVLALLATLKTA